MEELIWKYIDNDCTDEESNQVKQLLENDIAFKLLYQDILALDVQLKDNSVSIMTSQFRESLIQNIANQSVRSPKNSEILSISWWIFLTSIAAAVVALAILFPQENSLIKVGEIPIDEKTLSLATWSMVGFLSLILLDYLLNRKSDLTKSNFIV